MSFNIEQFIDHFPGSVCEELKIKTRDIYSRIDETVVLGDAGYIGAVKSIGPDSSIGNKTIISDGVKIGESVQIGDNSVLLKGVRLSSFFVAGDGVFFFENSGVSPAKRELDHFYYPRNIHNRSIVGPGVILPSEVQIGPDAIIPTQSTIAQIGPFGTSQRMITVHGSSTGARYNVGCQKEIDEDTFFNRICSNTETTEESAADYERNYSRIVRLAEKTQRAYEKVEHLVPELIRKTIEVDVFPI